MTLAAEVQVSVTYGRHRPEQTLLYQLVERYRPELAPLLDEVLPEVAICVVRRAGFTPGIQSDAAGALAPHHLSHCHRVATGQKDFTLQTLLPKKARDDDRTPIEQHAAMRWISASSRHSESTQESARSARDL